MNLRREIISLGSSNYKILRGGNPAHGSIIFLHGWNSKSERYIKTFSFLSENFPEIIIPDLPGFGESPKPQVVWGVNEYAAWVMEMTAALGIEKFVIAGHSFGGQISLALAGSNNPKIVGALLYASARVRKHASLKKAIFRGLAKTGGHVFSLPIISGFSGYAKKVIYHAAGSTDYLDAKEMREIMTKITNQEMSAIVPVITIPVGIIWGDNDKSTPVSDAYFLKKTLNDSNLGVVVGAGHKFHMDDPEGFAREFSQKINWILKGLVI